MFKKPFSPQVYTKHDKHGLPVPFKKQAEATADYLASKHWAAPTNEQERTNTIPITPLVPEEVEYDTSPITEAELEATIKRQKTTK